MNTNQQLAMLLRGHTPETARDLKMHGLVSQAAYDRYIVTWQWAAWHFGGCSPQERLRRTRGIPALTRRIGRCKARLAVFLAEN
jgi:hypothetical protein